jgi:hypothetical protein
MLRSLSLGCFLLALPTLAQPQQPPIHPPLNLGEALKLTYWNAEQRGPLLAVAADRVMPRSVNRTITPPPLPPSNGYNAQDISAFFNHQPFRVGGLTVVAPKTMRLFTRPTIAPEQAVALSREEAGMELLASLTQGQWQLIHSATGLGLSDLSERQKGYFLTLLPTRMSLFPNYQFASPTATPDQPRDLSETERQGARLRLARRIQLSYMIEGKTNQMISFGESSSAAEQRYQLNMSFGEDENEDIPDLAAARLYPKIPNRLKPSELDFAAPRLNATVSLKDLKTLGELLKRVGEATRLTLTADYRISGLPVYTRGEQARSGDVLQALCLGVCGAVRKLGPTTFLLTEDREGLTTRQAAYEKWQEKVQELREKRREEQVKKMEANGAGVPLDNTDSLSPETLKKVEDNFRPRKPDEEPGVTAAELPEKLRKQIEEAGKHEINLGDENGAISTVHVRTDRVMLRSEPQLLWVVPRLGSYPSQNNSLGWQLDMALRRKELMQEPPQQGAANASLLAPSWKQRVVVLAPQTPAQAREAVALAQKTGMTSVWISVPLDPAKAKSLLEAALAAGKATGISVGAQLRTGLPASEESKLLDRTPLGEPYSTFFETSTLAPLPETAQLLTTLVRTVTALPGLTGLNLAWDFPGYQRFFYEPSHRTLGYLPENRAAFLAQTGSDIFDVPARQYSSYPVPLGHFSNVYPQHIRLPDNSYGPDPAYRDLSKDWLTFRQDQLQAFLSTLDPVLTHLPCPCYSTLPSLNLLGVWKLPDLKKSASFQPDGDYEQAMLVQARRLSPLVLRPLSLWPQAKPEDFKKMLQRIATNDSKPNRSADGIVIDLSLRPFTEASGFLAALSSNKATPVR